MNTIDIYYIVAIWFLLLGISNKEYRPSSAILFVIYSFNIISDFLGMTVSMSYNEWLLYMIKLDGATAIMLTMVLTIDKHAWKQALILSFAVVCHFMISLYFITDSSKLESVSFIFYEYYDELIILTAILQMVVSLDGMVKGINSAFRFIQSSLLRNHTSWGCRFQSSYIYIKQKKSEKRT